MSFEIVHGDAAKLDLPDASVDLIVTSPPFWALRSYTDGGAHYDGQIGAEPTPAAYIDNLIDCTREWMRVLKPSGSLWINLGDKYATRYASARSAGRAGLNGDDDSRTRSGQNRTGVPEKSLLGLPWRYATRCIDDLGLILRAEVIWSKPNGLPESVTDRVRRSHETWFHFTRSPRYFAAVDTIREAHTMKPQRRLTEPKQIGAYEGQNKQTLDGPTGHAVRSEPATDGNPLGKLPGSVWEIATQPLKVPAELGIDHFAAFPMEWPRRIISGWSPPGGIVLDPFGGTGTTALVADALGRYGITVDKSADYCRLAAWRINDPKQRERAQRGGARR
jgi:DNA modification methylase